MALEDSRHDGRVTDVTDAAESSRGVLYPTRLPTFHREPVTGDLGVFVRWFWIPEWRIEPGRSSRQHLIGFPACNLVVENSITGISGPTTRASHRDLTGTGWAVGALLRPAAVPALVGDVSLVRDGYREAPFPELSSTVRAAMNAPGSGEDRRSAAVGAFTAWLRERLDAPSEEALLANHIVETVETNPDIRRVADLAAHVHISTRSLQRLTATYVGFSPAALIRRRRLQEAAEQLRQNPERDLTTLAHEFGYADHAHLTNDFRTTLGFTPSTYRRSLPSD